MKKVADVLTRGGIAGCSSADFAFANTSNPQPPPPPDALGFPLTSAQLQRKWRNPPTQPSTSGNKSPSLASSDSEDEIDEVESQPWYGGSVLIRYWSTTWSSWRHLEAFGAQKGVFRVVIERARHGSDQSGATPPSRSDLPIRATLPERQGEVARVLVTRRRENEHGATSRSDTARSLPKPGATLPERQGEVARVFITRRRENEPGATSHSDTARSLPKPGATYRSDGLRSLRVLFLLELVISQGPFGATKRRIIFVLRKNHQKPLESDLFESIDQYIIEILCSYLFHVFLYMINLKSNMGLRGIIEITNEHSSRHRVCLGLCPSLSSKLDHPRSNPYIHEFSFPIVKKFKNSSKSLVALRLSDYLHSRCFDISQNWFDNHLYYNICLRSLENS
ncbi:hypothetical protein IGI04_035653 [Brassica rapa subsp. trilocularis]|uniref:Uncharacterized protein n=1 Tax=Brassica rapa subsp. trilocularis TaxID=1813537 RepID=A0ABQ7LC77_BRACM|nr:hypothetical protein IGI04_035653 [Brassica rapa subsp. trilocularis]